MEGLRLQGVYKSFGGTQAVADVSFSVTPGEILALLGPSGCGKSTVLGIIAGLLVPDRGDVFWDGRSMAGVPPHQRGFGLMFQDYALFPHLNVFDNVAFGLRMANLPPAEVKRRVREALELVRMQGFEERDVNTLSGGEQQRVALARSLAPQPRLLMLDEPLGSLDRTLRDALMVELTEILRQTHQTAIYVTHDQEEAFTLADRVVVMNKGRVEQIGAPLEIYRQPASTFVARFLGFANLLPGEVIRSGGRGYVQTAIGRLPIRAPMEGRVTVLVRQDAANLDGRGSFRAKGRLMNLSFRGNTCKATVQIDNVRLNFDFPSSMALPSIGEMVSVGMEPEEAFQLLPPE